MPTVNAPSATSRTLALAGLVCLCAATPCRAGSRLDSLLTNSPFGQSKTGQTAVVSNQALEFRGVSEESGQQLFSLYEATTKRTYWVSRHATGGDIVIKNFDATTNTLSVEQQGKPLTLTLKSGPRIAQQNPAASITPPGLQPGANGLPGLSNPPPNQTAKGPEAQRLQQIAEEIRKRRALRAQGPQMPNAMPGPGQGGGPQPMPNAAPGQGGPQPAQALLPGQSQGAGPMPLPGSTSSGPVPLPQPSR